MRDILTTPRLVLRPCHLSDLDALYRLWTMPAVRQFLFDDREISREAAQSFIADSESSFSAQGYGIWLFFERSSTDLEPPIAGFAGLLYASEESPAGSPSLIFGTHPSYWRRGYAREAAGAVLSYAFDRLGLNKVVADVDEPNLVSIRVLEALGMRQIDRAIVNDRPLWYYEIGG